VCKATRAGGGTLSETSPSDDSRTRFRAGAIRRTSNPAVATFNHQNTHMNDGSHPPSPIARRVESNSRDRKENRTCWSSRDATVPMRARKKAKKNFMLIIVGNEWGVECFSILMNSGAVRLGFMRFIGFQVPRILGIRSARAWAPPGSERERSDDPLGLDRPIGRVEIDRFASSLYVERWRWDEPAASGGSMRECFGEYAERRQTDGRMGKGEGGGSGSGKRSVRPNPIQVEVVPGVSFPSLCVCRAPSPMRV